MNDNKLEAGQLYTKKEITHICKGGNPNASIGVSNIHTFWMCVDPEVNPSFKYGPLPYGLDQNQKVYICGNGPGMISSAEKACKHKKEFPVFVKKSRKYLYIGNYKIDNFSYNKQDIAHYEEFAQKNTEQNLMLLFMRRIETNTFSESFEEFPQKDENYKSAA